MLWGGYLEWIWRILAIIDDNSVKCPSLIYSCETTIFKSLERRLCYIEEMFSVFFLNL